MTAGSIIKAVEVCVARVPLDSPIAFSTSQITAREYCLIRVRSADGQEGIGFTYARENAGELLAAAAQSLAPRLLHRNSLFIEAIWADLYSESLLLGRAGVVMRAQSAIDIALWDLNASRAGLPLYQYLGAYASDRVPAYASGGYYGPRKSEHDLAQEMRGFVDEGYTAVKMKVGKAGVAEDERRVAAVRSAIGPDIRLMLDANNAWQDVPTAIECLERFAPHRPFWIEEPFTPDDVDSHARLARLTRIPVATGECESGRWRFKQLLDCRAAEILQPDAIVCGGITEWRRIAATASSYGVSVAPHAWHDIHVHLVASTPNATYVEFMPDASIVNFRMLLAEQLVADHGDIILPTRPGLGIVLDDGALGRFAVMDSSGHAWRSVGSAH